ncbi:hypothetical protein ACP4OV_008934 [Aristida adscensionis]
MEATALSLAKSALESLGSVARSLFANELTLQLGVKQDLGFIQDEFATIQAVLVLVGADEHRRSRRSLDLAWVAQVRNLAHDAEDSLREFSVELGSKPSSWCRSAAARRCVGTMMKELRRRVEEVSQRRLRYYHLLDDSAARPPPVLAGRQDGQEDGGGPEVVDLVAQLLEGGGAGAGSALGPGLISAWGAGDAEARAAAVRHAYDDHRVALAFPCRAWINVPRSLGSTEDFLRDVLRQFYVNNAPAKLEEGGNAGGGGGGVADQVGQKVRQNLGLSTEQKLANMSTCEVAEEFARQVHENRYLIVLNNLSTVDERDFIKTYLIDSSRNSGNWVIVSAGRAECARMCAGQTSQKVYRMLSPYDHEPVYLVYGEGLHHAKDTNTVMKDDDRDRSKNTVQDNLRRVSNKKKHVKTAAATSYMEDSQFMWRDEEKTDLKNKLAYREGGESEHLKVISVHGIPGVGKTTLVRIVYQEILYRKEVDKPIVGNDMSSKSILFDNCAWVTMLHPFNKVDFLRNLVLKLRLQHVRPSGPLRERISTMGLDGLKEHVIDLLENKSTFIVLDDISSELEWDSISECLPKWTTCRVVLTTRNEGVAKHCSKEQGNILPLNALNEEHALGFFRKKVFEGTDTGTGNAEWPERGMGDQAKLIIKKCHGLPLLITGIGCFLASKPRTTIEWRKWNSHISAELQVNPRLESVKMVLSTIYDGLPYYIKPCFLYLSMFPKGHKIRRTRLVKRWVAEGYSKGIYGKTATETAELYFKELVNRSMIEKYKAAGTSNNSGLSDCYRVHDLVHDISISMSEEENLVLILDNDVSGSPDPGRKIRHLTISSSWRRDKIAFERAADCSHIRSMTVFGVWKQFFISKKMRFLRVLDLEDTRGLQDQDLEPMGNLHHLMYLSLRGSQGISQLPGSFGKLCSLETLDIRDTYVTKLPECIVKLQKLKYIRAGRVPSHDGPSTMKITEIPKELAKHLSQSCNIGGATGKSVSDEHVEEQEDYPSFCFRLGVLWKHRNVHGVEVPKGIKKLRDLHTLGAINARVSSGKETLKELKNLTQLRKLGVTGISMENSTELCSAISNLTDLESLSLRSEGKPGLTGCLDAISKPPTYLQSLKLYGCMEKLPEWIDSLHFLVKLSLRSTPLDYDAIPILGKLENLVTLRLQKKSIQGGVLNFRNNFPSLVVLELADMDDLLFVNFTERAMPKLELLLVRDCWSIDKMGISGLSYLTNIKQVLVEGICYRRFKADLEKQLPKGAILKVDTKTHGTSADKYRKTER